MDKSFNVEDIADIIASLSDKALCNLKNIVIDEMGFRGQMNVDDAYNKVKELEDSVHEQYTALGKTKEQLALAHRKLDAAKAEWLKLERDGANFELNEQHG